MRGLSLVPCNELRLQGTSSPWCNCCVAPRPAPSSHAAASLALCVAPLREPAGRVVLASLSPSSPLRGAECVAHGQPPAPDV